MPFKDPEKIKQYQKEYRENHKEYRNQQHKQWRQDNASYIYEKNKIWNAANPDKFHKSQKITRWKDQGMILKSNEDWESIYYFVESQDNCESCNKKFKNTRDRQLDHCHKTGFIRDVICTSCNVIRGYEDAK